MDDTQLLRYSRQIMLPDLDIAGQQKLLDATAMIVGLGGLGSPAALYLAAAGVGHLILVDDDAVDLSNLQRQIVHEQTSINVNKAESARNRLQRINPDIQIDVISQRLGVTANADTVAITDWLDKTDLVLDCTDNFSSRYLMNDACWAAGVPLVSGAAIRWEGQVTVFDPQQADSPCYRCLYPTGDDEALNCAENGVAAPLVGIIGTCQAMEALKYLSGVGRNLVGRVLYLDGKYMEWRDLRLQKRAGCETCSG